MHMMPRAWPSSSPACKGTGSFGKWAASGDRQQRKAACSSVHLKGSRVCRMGGGGGQSQIEAASFYEFLGGSIQ